MLEGAHVACPWVPDKREAMASEEEVASQQGGPDEREHHRPPQKARETETTPLLGADGLKTNAEDVAVRPRAVGTQRGTRAPKGQGERRRERDPETGENKRAADTRILLTDGLKKH